MKTLRLTTVLATMFRNSKFPSYHIHVVIRHRRLTTILHNRRHLVIHLSIGTLIRLLLNNVRQVLTVTREQNSRRGLLSLREGKVPNELQCVNDERFSAEVVLRPRQPAFYPRLDRRLAIVLIRSINFGSTLRAYDVATTHNVTNALGTLHPSLMIIEQRHRTLHVALILLRRLQIVLVAIARTFMLARFLIKPVVHVSSVLSTVLRPQYHDLSTGIIITFTQRLTLSITTLRCNLHRSSKNEGPVRPRLFFNFLHVLYNVHYILSRGPVSLS